MNRHHKSSIRLVLIIFVSAIVWVYGLNLDIGYGVVFLLAAVAYTIYLNFSAAKRDKKNERESYKI